MSFKAENYWKTRDFHTSARLHLQHWLFQSTIGFVLHPSISVVNKGKGLRIADLACGNGAWLSDVARLLPEAELHGYDITDGNYPAATFLPKTMSLHVLDVTTVDLPADLIGSFDIVHIRAFSSIIKNNDTGPLLTNVVKLLKPDGWFQWDEATPHKMTAIAPTTDVETSASQLLLHLMLKAGEWTGVVYDWFGTLATQLSSHGLCNVSVVNHENRPEQYKAWTEDYLIVYEELVHQIPPASVAGPNAPLTRESYKAMFEKVLEETAKGVVLHQQQVMVAIGQKQV